MKGFLEKNDRPGMAQRTGKDWVHEYRGATPLTPLLDAILKKLLQSSDYVYDWRPTRHRRMHHAFSASHDQPTRCFVLANLKMSQAVHRTDVVRQQL